MAIVKLPHSLRCVCGAVCGALIFAAACGDSTSTPERQIPTQDASADGQPDVVVDAGLPDDGAPGTDAADGEGGLQPQEERVQGRETLRKRLEALSDERLAFGAQDTTAYGIGWKWEEDRSDVKTLCAKHAAVQGWDIGHVGEKENLDGVPFDLMRKRIIEGHQRRAIITISWHERNPSNDKNCWDKEGGASVVLPGGTKHEFFKTRLDAVAEFFDSLVASDGTHIPVVFRPFHEHNKDFFWWGKSATSAGDYQKLWKFAADYLRVTKGQSQILLAIAPGGFVKSEQEYLYAYPGNDYVDVYGFDVYWAIGPDDVTRSAEIISQLAKARGKIAAFTEFGADGALVSPKIADDWFSTQVIGPLMASPKAYGIAWALTWRNHIVNEMFIPTPDERHAADFKKAICDDPRVLLEGEVP